MGSEEICKDIWDRPSSKRIHHYFRGVDGPGSNVGHPEEAKIPAKSLECRSQSPGTSRVQYCYHLPIPPSKD